MKLLIADDEIDVREGIRYLLDWQALGFVVLADAKNGPDTLQKILELQPDVVLMDIRMLKLSGLEVVKAAQEQGFCGKFIIISGYSDFAYAKEAIRYGVTCYLTKPIDEEELQRAVLEAKVALVKEQERQKKLTVYRDKARESILQEIILNQADYLYLDYHDLCLESAVYQIVLYTNYNQESFRTAWDFADILRLANKNHNSLEHIVLNHQDIILLKGDFALKRFEELVERHISQPQKGSPLDALFLTYGRPVYSIEHIHRSYKDACLLMKRRFFCSHNQHVLGFMDIPKEQEADFSGVDMGEGYAKRIADYIQTGNRRMIKEQLHKLREDLYFANEDVPILKHYLADIMIQVKASISRTYGSMDIPLPSNAAIISTVEEKYYLYEILRFFMVQFEMCANAISSPTRESVMEGILDYISHHYHENLKLGTIAELFGYNSSYLGKIFNKATGKNFNAYVDELRIERAKALLGSGQYKVYEVAQLVGYSNVDYFHKKFKKYVGASPAEFRKMDGVAD